jgi:alkylation response protein AidB-like acyl-CoA dehydrogenase
MTEMERASGGVFLLTEASPTDVFTPEDLDEEHHMMISMTEDFMNEQVMPLLPEIEEQNFEHTVKLFKQAGSLGLLGADVPEAFGGLGLDKICSTLITERMAIGRSFALSVGAHTGIGTLPIVFFGNEQQKQAYLPGLASGELIAAYALTEPTSGSDALGAKAKATLSTCGNYYYLTGEKQWITNSAFADLFIVYAKIDGVHFSAFIVEKGYKGVTTGPEEKKMGIKGSSTRTLILDEAKVPVENLLGEPGKGHVIAFNILNMGRFKLAAGCVGSCNRAIKLSVRQAKERKQFNTSIAQFPLIQAKLADMTITTYVMESMVYRTAGLIESKLSQLRAEQNSHEGTKAAKAIAEYAIECSVNKVYGSEGLDNVIDEAVQIFGGYGYMSEYEVENMYRDSRINRIFEGTNEINRLLIPDMLMRKALKGELDLLSAAVGLQEELLMMVPDDAGSDVLELEQTYIKLSKKLFLMLVGLAAQKYGTELEQEQELLTHISDFIISIYAMESTLLRTQKAVDKHGEVAEKLKIDITRVALQELYQKLESLGRASLCIVEEGDTLRTMLSLLRKLTRHMPFNTVRAKREIAQSIIKAGQYRV